MTINLASFSRRFVTLSYFGLIPGYFFYHSAVATGYIGLVLGGYISPVALGLLPVLALIYLRKRLAGQMLDTRVDNVFLAYIMFSMLVIGANLSLGSNGEVLYNHAFSLVQTMTLFLIFRLADFQDNRLQTALFACLVAMVAIIFIYSPQGVFLINRESDNVEAVASHQGFAQSFLYTLLVLAPFASSKVVRWIAYALSIPALYMIGARSEVLAALVAMLIIEYSRSRVKTLAFLIAGVLIAVVSIYFDDIVKVLPESRVTQLLNLSQSGSWDLRLQAQEYALRTIANNPILGDYGVYAARYYSGFYAHNILSAWVDIGLIGFVFLSLMLLMPFKYLLLHSGRRRDSMFAFALVLVVVTVFMLCTTKSFRYMPIGGALGAYAVYRSTLREKQAQKIRIDRAQAFNARQVGGVMSR